MRGYLRLRIKYIPTPNKVMPLSSLTAKMHRAKIVNSHQQRFSIANSKLKTNRGI